MEINLNSVWGFDSVTYRKIFEFIKREGIESFDKFVNDVAIIKNKGDLLGDAVFNGNQPFANLIEENKTVVEFLREFKTYFLHQNGIDSTGFIDFIRGTSKNIDKLDIYVENAKRLEELKICNINFANLKDHWVLRDSGFGRIQVWRESGKIVTIRKAYTDGAITYSPIKDRSNNENGYEEFGIGISPNNEVTNSPTWLIQCENHEDGCQFRYALIESFAFNGDQLPPSEELSKYDEPQSLKLYRKSR